MQMTPRTRMATQSATCEAMTKLMCSLRSQHRTLSHGLQSHCLIERTVEREQRGRPQHLRDSDSRAPAHRRYGHEERHGREYRIADHFEGAEGVPRGPEAAA